MKKKILVAIAGSVVLSALFAFLINEALFKKSAEARASGSAEALVVATAQAAALKAQNIEKDVEDLVSLGIRQDLGADLEQSLNQDILSIYVYDQSSRESVWTWENSKKAKLNPTKLATSFAEAIFETRPGWLVLDNKGVSYPLLVTRRLLLFPEEKTEKEVSIVSVLNPDVWAQFTEELAQNSIGLALYTSKGELMASSSPEVVRLQRRLGATEKWLKNPVHWGESPVDPERLRLSTRSIEGGKIWLLSFFATAPAKESFAFFSALFLIFLAFSLMIGGGVLMLMPAVVLPEVFADDDEEIEDEVKPVRKIEAGPVAVHRSVETFTETQSENPAELRLNESERFGLVKSVAREVSRELIRPLTSILGHVQIGREIKTGENSHWNSIESEARKAKKFVESLRAVSGDLPGRADSRVSLEDVVKSQMRKLHWQFDALKVSVEGDLSSEALVMGDVYALEEAFSALILNAAEAVQHQTHRTINVNVYDEGTKCVVEIKDNGPGVDEAMKAKIFEPFYSTKKEDGHHGLGLSLARAIFENQGADFHFASEAGVGTHILVKFPRVKPLEAYPQFKKIEEDEEIDGFEITDASVFSEERLNEELTFVGEPTPENTETEAAEDSFEPTRSAPRKVDQVGVQIRLPKSGETQ